MTQVAIIFTIVVHSLGIPVMIWAVRGDDGLRGLFGWWPKDDDHRGDGGSPRGDDPKPGAPPSGGLPLPDAEPARTRLREHGDRVAAPGRRRPRRTRPSTPAPDRERTREPAGH